MKTEALTTTTPQPVERQGAFSCPEAFETAQRMARLLCASTIVPESYRANLGDCVIALEMANRIGANPLAVMQNLYIVHGKPAWSSQFLIACLNASGRFSPLRYRMDGTGDDYGCTAWATDRTAERLEGPKVTLSMAKAEGWFSKNGSKWKTMPELMLRYRAATLFARLYAPELTMGLHTDDEIIDIAPVVTDPVKAAKPAKLSEIRTVKPSVKVEPEATQDTPPEPAESEPRREEKQQAPEVPVGGPPPLSEWQERFSVLCGAVVGEIAGADPSHVISFARAKSPEWKDEVTHPSEIPDVVCERVCKSVFSLRKYVSELVAARKGGAA